MGHTHGEDWTPISPTKDNLGDSKNFNFSPYSSLYSSPVSAMDGIPFTGREWPLDGKGKAERRRSQDRGRMEGEESGNRIELRDVKPAVLRTEDDGMGRAF